MRSVRLIKVKLAKNGLLNLGIRKKSQPGPKHRATLFSGISEKLKLFSLPTHS